MMSATRNIQSPSRFQSPEKSWQDAVASSRDIHIPGEHEVEVSLPRGATDVRLVVHADAVIDTDPQGSGVWGLEIFGAEIGDAWVNCDTLRTMCGPLWAVFEQDVLDAIQDK